MLDQVEKKLEITEKKRSSRLVLGGTFLGLNDLLHLFTLPLGGRVGSEALFAEFKCTFVLGDPEQLDASFFVGGETSDFTDYSFDDFGFFSNATSFPGLIVFVSGEFGDFVALFRSDDHGVDDSHVVFICKFDLRL